MVLLVLLSGRGFPRRRLRQPRRQLGSAFVLEICPFATLPVSLAIHHPCILVITYWRSRAILSYSTTESLCQHRRLPDVGCPCLTRHRPLRLTVGWAGCRHVCSCETSETTGGRLSTDSLRSHLRSGRCSPRARRKLLPGQISECPVSREQGSRQPLSEPARRQLWISTSSSRPSSGSRAS